MLHIWGVAFEGCGPDMHRIAVSRGISAIVPAVLAGGADLACDSHPVVIAKTFNKVAFMVRTVAGEEYLAILLLLIIALLFGVLTLFFGRFFRMRRPYREKLMPYESGNEPTAAPRTRFSIKFYYVAILFVIVDVEAIYLYTWAVEFVRLGSLGLVEMLTFMTLLILAYAYAWKKGALEWVK